MAIFHDARYYRTGWVRGDNSIFYNFYALAARCISGARVTYLVYRVKIERKFFDLRPSSPCWEKPRNS